MRNLCIRIVVLAAMTAPLVACGSSPRSDAFGDPGGSDTSVTTDGGGTDTAASIDTGLPPTDTGRPSDTNPLPTDTTPPPIDSGPGPVTLDNVCDRLEVAICSPTTKSCCTSRSVAFSDTGCRDNVKSYCTTLVDEAKAGSRTFDPTKFEGCAAAWKSLTTTCSVPLLTWIKTYAVCDQLLNGSMKPGDGACALASDCNAAPGTLADCSSATTCANYLVVGKDQPCNYDGATRRFCDYGLYCPFTGGTTKCLNAKGLGSGGCSGGSDPSCGWGNRCDSTNHCATGLPAGSLCSGDLQCSSWACTGGRCGDPNVEMAIPTTCGG